MATKQSVLCPDCGSTFDTEQGLKIHIGKKHGGVDVFCEHCGEEFHKSDRQFERANRHFCSNRCKNLERRGGAEVSFNLHPRPRWFAGRRYVFVHQLLAISEGADPAKVFSNGKYQVHHKNNCRYDNRPGNIELIKAAEHGPMDSANLRKYSEGDILAMVSFMLTPGEYL